MIGEYRKLEMLKNAKISGILFPGLLVMALLTGCNSSTSALGAKESAKKSGEASANADGQASLAAEGTAEEAQQLELAKVINKTGKVKNRGVYIKILVNKDPITNFDLQRRAKFLQLRRTKGNRAKVAEKELIEQAIKLREARTRNLLATDKMVNDAFANFARQNRTSTANLSRELERIGIGAPHFKDFIRSQIGWQRVVQARFQAQTSQSSERDIVTQLRKSGDAKPEVTEYNLQQIIFVVPANKRSKSTLAARRKEAVAFKQRFSGCEGSLAQAKLLRDVSIVDRKRLMEPELPDNWRQDIIAIEGNGTTRVKDTEKGVEIMAICNKRIVSDDRAAQVSSQSAQFANFNSKESKVAQDYLDQLMKRSIIVYQ